MLHFLTGVIKLCPDLSCKPCIKQLIKRNLYSKKQIFEFTGIIKVPLHQQNFSQPIFSLHLNIIGFIYSCCIVRDLDWISPSLLSSVIHSPNFVCLTCRSRFLAIDLLPFLSWHYFSLITLFTCKDLIKAWYCLILVFL